MGIRETYVLDGRSSPYLWPWVRPTNQIFFKHPYSPNNGYLLLLVGCDGVDGPAWLLHQISVHHHIPAVITELVKPSTNPKIEFLQKILWFFYVYGPCIIFAWFWKVFFRTVPRNIAFSHWETLRFCTFYTAVIIFYMSLLPSLPTKLFFCTNLPY